MNDSRGALAAALRRQQQHLLDQGEQALREAVTAGALALDHELEAAVTDTGYFRMLIRGGRPGRHETGNMVSKIRTDGRAPKRDDGVITMAYGWFAGDFEAYFREQDQGTAPLGNNRRGVPAAEALYDRNGNPGQSTEVARQTLRAAMRRIR